ncbi:MAG: T9SS type A sorting domain-containing protein [Bacteroidota bacterium]
MQFLLPMLIALPFYAVGQSCGLPGGCAADGVTLFQSTCNFPSGVATTFSCEQYVNFAIDRGYLGAPYTVSSTRNPNTISADNCGSFNIGLITIPSNAANFLVADVAHFGGDHYAYRINSSKYVSKTYPIDKHHIVIHETDLSCYGHGAFNTLWKYVGNEITASPSSAKTGNTIHLAANSPVTLSLINTSGVTYSWSSNSSNISFGSPNSASTSVTLQNYGSCTTNPTISVTYRGVGMAANTARTQTYSVDVTSCGINGKYTYGSTCKVLSTFNSTTSYASQVTITDCPDNSLTWTKTSGSGSFWVGSGGKSVSIYLNAGQSISFNVSGGGVTKSIAFSRSSGGGGWGWYVAPPNDNEASGTELPNVETKEVQEQDISFEHSIGLSEKRKAISVFPNPTRGNLTLAVPDALAGETVTIYDVTSKILYQNKATALQQEIDLSALSNGIYILAVGEERIKFVKQ